MTDNFNCDYVYIINYHIKDIKADITTTENSHKYQIVLISLVCHEYSFLWQVSSCVKPVLEQSLLLLAAFGVSNSILQALGVQLDSSSQLILILEILIGLYKS